MRFTMTIPAAAAVWSALAFAPAAAHHSTAMFDADNPIELAGTVLEWQFANPHCVIMLEVADEGGGTVVWALEGGSPNLIFRQGWRPDSLQPGDRIMATVHPLRSGAPAGNYRNLRWSDGTPIDPTAAHPAAERAAQGQPAAARSAAEEEHP